MWPFPAKSQRAAESLAAFLEPGIGVIAVGEPGPPQFTLVVVERVFFGQVVPPRADRPDHIQPNVIKLRPDRFPEVALQAGFGLIRCGCMLKSDPDNLSGLG